MRRSWVATCSDPYEMSGKARTGPAGGATIRRTITMSSCSPGPSIGGTSFHLSPTHRTCSTCGRAASGRTCCIAAGHRHPAVAGLIDEHAIAGSARRRRTAVRPGVDTGCRFQRGGARAPGAQSPDACQTGSSSAGGRFLGHLLAHRARRSSSLSGSRFGFESGDLGLYVLRC